MSLESLPLLVLLGLLSYALGLINAVHAVMHARTPQGAIAWSISLITLPFFALPLFWIFGRRKFQGYMDSRRKGNLDIHHVGQRMRALATPFYVTPKAPYDLLGTLNKLTDLPFTRGNRIELLIDGKAGFPAMLDTIERARGYLLLQSFIVHDDEVGRRFQRALIDKARLGVRVYFLYDEIGCHDLPLSYIRALRHAGVEMLPFKTTRGPSNRFQINFRNHRKILVADGVEGYLGGLNLGDEYDSRSKRFGYWRDTHLKAEGPAVKGLQISFVEDWHWATGRVPELDWTPRVHENGKTALMLQSGPADDAETCALFFLLAIQAAKERLWIASPYFVPDEQMINALHLAVLRGVDVRILLPHKADHLLVYLSSFHYIKQTAPFGIRFFRYQPGFFHQKALLIDDAVAAIGTANMDNRSFRLNFEITAVTADRGFAAQVAAMLERDLAQCREVDATDYDRKPAWFKAAARTARLMSPVQ